jgi:hypothetical protein
MAKNRSILRAWLMLFVAIVITSLFVIGLSGLWRSNFRGAILFLSVGIGLTFIFYRRKLMILAVCSCGFLMSNAALSEVVHPSLLGVLTTFGTLAGFIFFSLRLRRRYPDVFPTTGNENTLSEDLGVGKIGPSRRGFTQRASEIWNVLKYALAN